MAVESALPNWVEPRRYPDLRDDGVMLEGQPDKALTEQFVRYRKRRLFINYALGSGVADLDFLADFGSQLEALHVIHGAIDDTGIRHCTNLRDLSLNTRRSGVVDWPRLSSLKRLFTYGGRFGKGGFDALRLHDLYLYAPKMRDLLPLTQQPLQHLALAPASSLRTLKGLEAHSLTSLMLARTHRDLDLAALSSQTELQHLRLKNVAVESLDWLAGMPRLRTLTLGDVGPLLTLAPLRGHPRLERLLIHGKNRPPAAEAEIVAALPNLHSARVVGMDLPRRLTRG